MSINIHTSNFGEFKSVLKRELSGADMFEYYNRIVMDVDRFLQYVYDDIRSSLELDDRIENVDEYRLFISRCKNELCRMIDECKALYGVNEEKMFICDEMAKLSEMLCDDIRDSFGAMTTAIKNGRKEDYDKAYAHYYCAKDFYQCVEQDFISKKGGRAIDAFDEVERDFMDGRIDDDVWEEEYEKEEYEKTSNRYKEYVKDIKRRCVEKFPKKSK